MPPNQAPQRTGDQRPFVARWSGRRSVVVRPPPLSFGVAMTSDVKSGPQLFLGRHDVV
jgi:hypothetical protein